MPDIFLDQTSSVLVKVLDGTAARQRVLANNVANADTPGFTRKDLAFEDELRNVLSQPTFNPDQKISAVERVQLNESEDELSPRQADGNNVNVEHEMVDMAKNSLQYDSAAQLLNLQFQELKSAIQGT